MEKDKYLIEIRRQLNSFYRQVKAGHLPAPLTRHRIEGFMQAGIFLGLYTCKERDELLGAVHRDVFGVSVAIRQEQLSHLWQRDGKDYSEFDTPTWNRKR